MGACGLLGIRVAAWGLVHPRSSLNRALLLPEGQPPVGSYKAVTCLRNQGAPGWPEGRVLKGAVVGDCSGWEVTCSEWGLELVWERASLGFGKADPAGVRARPGCA